MFAYQKNRMYFAQVAGGMEEMGMQELESLGAKGLRKVYRGVYFRANQRVLYHINYNARLLTRILAPLSSFPCSNTTTLYNRAKELNWQKILSPDKTFAIFANVSHSKITHSKYAALRLKDALADYFREQCGQRPNVDVDNPDVWINLFIDNNKATISLDTSGGSLHKRGYRLQALEAPMQETLAAAIIRFSRWDGETGLWDPMCGSGTLVCEALMHYCRIPAGYLRTRFGFEVLPDFDSALWQSVKEEAQKKMRPLPAGKIMASDISRKAVALSKKNCDALPYHENVSWSLSDVRQSEGASNITIITNPPHGIRLGEKEEVALLYRDFGAFLKKQCKKSVAYVYIGDRDLIKKVGLKPSFKKPMVSGAIDGRLCKFEVY